MKSLDRINVAVGVKITIASALFGATFVLFDETGPGIHFARKGPWIIAALVFLGLSVFAGIGVLLKGAGLTDSANPPQKPTDNVAFRRFWQGQILFLVLGGILLIFAAV